MFANICLSKVFPDASEQRHPLQENTTHRQTTIKQPISCELCDKAFLYPENLEKHRQKHAASSPKQMVDYISAAVPAIERQKVTKEEKNAVKRQRGHQCEWCSKFFFSASTLNRHRQKHAKKGHQRRKERC